MKEYLRWRVGLLDDAESSEYFSIYSKALKRYHELTPMFDNVHLVLLEIKETILE